MEERLQICFWLLYLICICSSSLFVEKLWKETVICLKTVEEKIEGERGRGRRGNTKAKRIEGKSHRV